MRSRRIVGLRFALKPTSMYTNLNEFLHQGRINNTQPVEKIYQPISKTNYKYYLLFGFPQYNDDIQRTPINR